MAIYGTSAKTPFVLTPSGSRQIIYDRYYISLVECVYLSYDVILVRRPPPFFAIGWALRRLDRNIRRTIRQQIFDNVLGTARDNKPALVFTDSPGVAGDRAWLVGHHRGVYL